MGRNRRWFLFRMWIYRSSLLLMLLAGMGMPISTASSAAASTPASTQAGGQPGISWTGQAGISETTAQIMARQAVTGRSQTSSGSFFNGKLTPASRPVNPASASLTQGPAPQAIAPAAVSALTLGLTFNGPDYNANPCGTPPDTMGAVGPTQFVITVNCLFISYNKTTGVADGVLNVTPDNFFSSVRNGVGTSDPHIRYDRISSRWFIVMINVAFPDNRIMLAVSDTAILTNATVWTFYSFQDSITGHSNCLGDYPTPGIDANAIYIGVNQFCGLTLNNATYLTADGFVVQKSSVLSGGPIHVTAFPNLDDPANHVGLFTPQGVDNPDPAATEGYFIGADFNVFGLLQLRRITNPGSATPTISGNIAITIPTQSNPLTQPHMGNTGGSSGNLDGSDGRLFEAYFRNGSLWTSLDSGANATCGTSGIINRNAVVWYEITGIPGGSTPTVHQTGVICDPAASNPAYYSYGTIMVNGQGHAAVGYTIAGAANFTTPGVSTRLAGDALTTLGPNANLVPDGTFLHAYNPIFDNGGSAGRRWGDYSYTSLDPCDDMTLWTVQEYASSANIYGMRVAQLIAPPPAAPASAGPGSVSTGQASVDVVITGTSTNGSGFYDTPSSLTDACRKRLTATVSGGVTVNSVTYTDPTHVTLNISTVGASAGAKDVTITNPDGQSLVGAGILTVTTANNTNTALASSVNPSVFGQTVMFTATVSSSGGTPDGSVQFFDGAASLGTVSLVAGSASLSTSTLAVGAHAIKADYLGSTSFNLSSGSLAGGQTVGKATAGVILTSLAQGYNGTPRPIGATTTPPGLSVSFSYNGSATPPTNAGSYPVTATVNDANFTGSANGTLVVSPAATTLVLVSSMNPSQAGQIVTFTATVTSDPGLTPSGSVTFTLDGSPSIQALNPGGVAALASGPLTGGSHPVTAVFTGSTNFAASTMANLTQVVNFVTFVPTVLK